MFNKYHVFIINCQVQHKSFLAIVRFNVAFVKLLSIPLESQNILSR